MIWLEKKKYPLRIRIESLKPQFPLGGNIKFMEAKELQDKLNKIIEKRKNCIQLTPEEELIAKNTVNKLLDAKKCVRKELSVTTGDELRKAGSSPTLPKAASTSPSFEGGNPKNRGKEGGFDSKADIDERQEVTPDPKKLPKPLLNDKEISSDKKEEKKPAEDTSGEVQAVYTEDDTSNLDGKDDSSRYEEDRIGNAVKDKDIVIKPVKKGVVLVGHVLKVYATRTNGQSAALVKWSDGRFSHENTNDLQVIVEKKIPSPAGFVSRVAPKAGAKVVTNEEPIIEKPAVVPVVEKPAAAPVVEKPVDVPVEEKPTSDNIAENPPKAFVTNCSNALAQEDPNLGDDDRIAICVEIWRQLVTGEVTPETESAQPEQSPQAEASVSEPAVKAADATGEKPPSDWLDNCVKSVKEKSPDVDNPYAVCMATWNKMVLSDFEKLGDDSAVVKISADDMEPLCQPCAQKMRDRKVKFLKIKVDNISKLKG